MGISINIALAIIVLTWSAFAVHAINTRPMRTIIKTTPKEAWAYAIIAGVFIGAIFYTVQNTAAPTPLAIVYYILMASSFGALGYACYSAPSVKLLEILPLGLLAVVCWYVMSSISETISIGGHLLTFIHLLPHVLCIATIGFFIAHACHFRYKEMHKGKSWRNGCAITAIVTIAFMVATPMSIGSGNPFEEIDAKLPTGDAVVAEASSGESEDDFTQKPINHDKNREDSDFSAKLDRDEASGIPREEASRIRTLENCRTNAEFLAKEAKVLGLKNIPEDFKVLASKDGEGLSKKGKKLYHKVEGLYETADAVREEAPEDGYNSGYNNGTGYVVSSFAGISGDRSATKFTFKNGMVIWKMDRCGNNVTRKPPKVIPPGKTDDPDPPTSTTPVKDPKQGSKEDTGPNKGKGPGTVPNGPAAGSGTDDQKGGSKEYNDAVQEKKNSQNQNSGQKTGSSSNNSSTPPPSNNTKVDNNGARDNTGSQKPSYNNPSDGSSLTNGAGTNGHDNNDGQWSGPAD